jgi:hypothetical protein
VPAGSYINFDGKTLRVTNKGDLYDPAENKFYKGKDAVESKSLVAAEPDKIGEKDAKDAPEGAIDLRTYILNRIDARNGLISQLSDFFSQPGVSQDAKDAFDKFKKGVINEAELRKIIENEQKNIIEDKAKKYVIKKAMYELVYQLLDETLGKFAYKLIDKKCEDDWKASETDSNKGVNVNSQVNDDILGKNKAGCNSINNSSFTAQASKKLANQKYAYKYSWSIINCNNAIDYEVFLKDTTVKKTIASGNLATNSKATKSGNSQDTNYYSSICIDFTAAGQKTEYCFPVIG